jgi:hypothetical protein
MIDRAAPQSCRYAIKVDQTRGVDMLKELKQRNGRVWRSDLGS